MLRFVLFAYRPLADVDLCHTLAIPDNPDAEFTPSDEDFRRHVPGEPAVAPPSHTAEGRFEVDAMERRIICCAGNFLEVKQHHGRVASCEELPRF